MKIFQSRYNKHRSAFTMTRATSNASIALCFTLGIFVPATLYAQKGNSEPIATTFLVVRHAERDGNLDKLTEAGEQRAQTLAAVGSALKVNVIYSTNTQRTRNTAKPLATKRETEIQTYRTPSKQWLTSLQKEHAGKVVLIVGHSNTAGLIAGLLANEKPYELGHDEYDALFIVQVSESETRSIRLRYGESSKGASSAAPDKMGELEPAR